MEASWISYWISRQPDLENWWLGEAVGSLAQMPSFLQRKSGRWRQIGGWKAKGAWQPGQRGVMGWWGGNVLWDQQPPLHLSWGYSGASSFLRSKSGHSYISWISASPLQHGIPVSAPFEAERQALGGCSVESHGPGAQEESTASDSPVGLCDNIDTQISKAP